MRWSLAALFGSALVARHALAELTFTVEATQDGVPIPQSEIKLEPQEFVGSHIGQETAPNAHRKTRRTNSKANSSNWCGSVNTVPSSNQIKVIHGTFQHPSCSRRTGVTSYPQAAANWIGIDGDSWTSALLQAGTVCKIESSTGVVKHEAWWQWVPSDAYTITSMTVSPDDWIEVTINTTSTTAGEITLSNLSTHQTYTMKINAGPALARVNADWVVERPYFGSTLSEFADFTDVWFDEAWATQTSGSSVGIMGAKQYQIPGLCASQEWDDQHVVSWSL